jgi:CMP-N-acetylneuraminate monooxygenase
VASDGSAKLLIEISKTDIPLGISFHCQKTIIIFRSDEDKFRATRNICRHQGGRFVHFNTGKKCYLKCPNHDWSLNAETMTYENPSNGLKQDELILEVRDKSLAIFEDPPNRPWENFGGMQRTSLQRNEFEIKFYAHACAQIKAGKISIFTDPWLIGPAFVRGWWLAHLPPADWLDQLSTASAIYISHNHSDHLNVPTLKELVQRNPNVLMIAPGFKSRSVEKPLEQLGFKNIIVAEFGKWHTFDPETRLMVLPDSAGRDDSGLLIEFKGHQVLNTVDCANLNNGSLPKNIDALLSSFASGATGFPVCWGEMYDIKKIKSMIERNRLLSLKHFVDTTREVSPRIAIPFAGYFREAHPSDQEVAELNHKNSSLDVPEKIAQEGLESHVWIPRTGVSIDIGFPQDSKNSGIDEPRKLESYEFDKYMAEITEDASCTELNTLNGIKKYFEWAGYRANHVLHIVETDENFKNIVREFMIDFESLEIAKERPKRPHQYSRIRIRSSVFRHVLKRGLPWEDFSIGFQARFYREPDVYELGFWDHFQNMLPSRPAF